jgi:hypothetical protein
MISWLSRNSEVKMMLEIIDHYEPMPLIEYWLDWKPLVISVLYDLLISKYIVFFVLLFPEELGKWFF